MIRHKICHNCKGTGFVESTNSKGICLYCKGKGIRGEINNENRNTR